MDNEFHRRQQELERRKQKSSKHTTQEITDMEQGEANRGHIPDPRGTDAVPPEPSLWAWIRAALFGRK